jgi:hypothetical protein
MATSAYSFGGSGSVPILPTPQQTNAKTVIPGFNSQPKTAQIPIYGANGLITGYQTGAGGPSASSSGAQTPIYGTGGVITGYTNSATPAAAPAVNTANQPSNNPSNDFSLISVNKSPTVAATADQLQTQAGATDQQTNQTFQQYLTAAQNEAAQNATTLAANEKTLATSPADYASQLAQINSTLAANNQAAVGTQQSANTAYQTASDQQQAQAQQDIANEQAAILAQAGNSLTYATDAQKLGKATSGTPGSLGGADIEASAQNYANIEVPAQEQAAQLGLQNVYQFQQPVAEKEQQQGTALAGTQLGVAGQQAQLQTQAVGLVQNLKTQIAEGNYGINDAVQYLSSLGLPIQLAQSVLSGNVSNEAAISALMQSNAFQGLATNYQQTSVAFPTYSNAAPGGPAGVQVGPTPLGGTTSPTTTATNGYTAAPTGSATNGYTGAQVQNQLAIQNAGQSIGYGPAEMPSAEDMQTIASQTGLPLQSVQAFYSYYAQPAASPSGGLGGPSALPGGATPYVDTYDYSVAQ